MRVSFCLRLDGVAIGKGDLKMDDKRLFRANDKAVCFFISVEDYDNAREVFAYNQMTFSCATRIAIDKFVRGLQKERIGLLTDG